MVLVVNKMERTSEGNTPEQQAIIAEDIKKVIEPLSPQDVYLSFIDAQSFIDNQNADDDEERALYYQMSGYEQFYKNLNHFVDEHKLASKILDPLISLRGAIVSSIQGMDRESGLMAVDAGDMLTNVESNLKKMVDESIEECTAKIINAGANAAMQITPGAVQDNVNYAISDALSQCDCFIQDACNQIGYLLADVMQNIGGEMNELSPVMD